MVETSESNMLSGAVPQHWMMFQHEVHTNCVSMVAEVKRFFLDPVPMTLVRRTVLP